MDWGKGGLLRYGGWVGKVLRGAVGGAGSFHWVVRGGAGSGWGKLVLISVGVRNGGPEAPPWSFQRLLLGSGGRLSFPVLCILMIKLCPF